MWICARRDERVDPPALRALQRLGGPVDVAGGDARERRDHRARGRSTRSRARRRTRPPTRSGTPPRGCRRCSRASCSAISTFSALRERDAGRLLAVAQGRVEDPDYGRCRRATLPSLHRGPPSSRSPTRASSGAAPVPRPRAGTCAPRCRSREEVGEAAVGLRDPLLRERAVLDLVEDRDASRRAVLVVDHPRAARVVAVLGRVARSSSASTTGRPRTSGPRSASARAGTRSTRSRAGSRPRRASRTRPGPAPSAAAEHGLLAEEVGLGLLLERGLDARRRAPRRCRPRRRAPARAPCPVASWCTATSAGVPMPCSYVRRTRWPGALRRDHRDVDVGRRRDRPEVDVEAVGEHQHVAGFEVRARCPRA